MPISNVSLTYGKQTFTVKVIFEQRNQLAITVFPDKKIIARAPETASLDAVLSRLENRKPWIAKQLHYFEQFYPLLPEKEFVSGETHYYLGRQYRLRIREGNAKQVKLKGRFFWCEVPDINDNQLVKQLMQQWYSLHARKIIEKRKLSYLGKTIALGGKEPTIKIRQMKTRWGSCTPEGVITINTELIKTSILCVDYVLAHELCHLVHANHTVDYYHLLDKVMPDWRERKEKLEKSSL